MSQPPCRPAAKPKAAGPTPKEMTSANESSSRPSGECWWRQRATLPSKMSKTKASGVIAADHRKCVTEPLAMNSIARNTDSMPQAALPSVMKSARWKPRIIEK